MWSDIPNNRQLRWLEDDGQRERVPQPSNNSNGNTFDFQGRQLSCEHLTRRVVRYEHDGSVTVIADALRRQAAELAQRRRAASGRQLLVHRSALRRPALRGRAGRRRRPEQPAGPAQARAWARRSRSAAASASCRPNCYRIDPSGRVDLVVGEDQVPDPNGLCFSPDYKKLYVVSTGKGPGDTGPGGKGDMCVFDVGSDNKALQRQALQRLHGRRREVRAGRRARATWTATSGARAMPAATSATAA